MNGGRDGANDEGLVSVPIAVIIVAFVVVLGGILQLGLAGDRSGKTQIAADAGALAGAQSIADALSAEESPTEAAPSDAAVGADAEQAAVRFAQRNLPGLPRSGVTVEVEGNDVSVEIEDTRPLPLDKIKGARQPRYTASAVGRAEPCLPADAEAGSCEAEDVTASLVE